MEGTVTDREYELEAKLWDVLMAVQDYIIAVNLNESSARKHAAFTKMQKFVVEWRENMLWYLQHPKWNEVHDHSVSSGNGQE